MRYPTWFLNAVYFAKLARRSDDRRMNELFSACYFSTLCLRWIEANQITGNADNQKVCRICYQYLRRFCDFGMIQKPYGGLEPVVTAYRRLKGLTVSILNGASTGKESTGDGVQLTVGEYPQSHSSSDVSFEINESSLFTAYYCSECHHVSDNPRECMHCGAKN